MAQWVKHLLNMGEDQSLDFQNPCKSWADMAASLQSQRAGVRPSDGDPQSKVASSTNKSGERQVRKEALLHSTSQRANEKDT